MTDEDPKSRLKLLLAPIVKWMTEHDLRELHLTLGAPEKSTPRPQWDQTAALLWCDKVPDAPGTLGVYQVLHRGEEDPVGGPLGIPSSMLQPLLLELGRQAVKELHIQALVSSVLTSASLVYDPDEFDEYGPADPIGILDVVVAVRAQGSGGADA